MKKIQYIITGLIGILLASCSAEAPFEGPGEGKGRVLTTGINLEVKSNETTVRASSNVPTASDFTVEFYKKDNDETAVESYLYNEMPDIVILPVGEYYIRASYGGDYGTGKNAEFNKPYYAGETEVFTVEENKIVDSFNTIKCSLANVKVSISFSEELQEKMSQSSTVTVKVGKSSELDFNVNTEDEGFFQYDEGSTTLVATFSGLVEDIQVVETKQYSNVKPGNFYKITFKLHSIGNDEPVVPDQPNETPDPNNPPVGPDEPDEPKGDGEGNVTVEDNNQDGPGIVLDATVNVVGDAEDTDIDITEEDELLTDVTVPDDNNGDDNKGDNTPGNDQPGNTPGTGDQPGIEEPNTPNQPETELKKIEITCNDPENADLSGYTLITEEKVENGMTCELYIRSASGLTEFVVEITSDNDIFKSAIDEMFPGGIDIVNEHDYWGQLEDNLDIPVNVKGETSVDFSITNFLPLLINFSGTHEFKIKVSNDQGGSLTKTLKLKV